MREIADDEAGVADVSTVPQSFEGSERVLACFQLLEIEPGSAPTTNLMHAGCCQFMRIHEGS
jgi:hypothetical protein